MSSIDNTALDQLFRTARTHYQFSGTVSEQDLRDIYALTKMGPTSANGQPGRFVFLTTPQARERLRPALSAGNLEKTLAAPVVVIIAYDLQFYDNLPRTYPHTDARSWYVGQPALIETTALRNSSLQGAYFMMAARALGWDVGPMSGFDNAKLDAEFFPDGRWKSNFICNLGRGNPDKLHPRNLRLEFEEVCQVR